MANAVQSSATELASVVQSSKEPVTTKLAAFVGLLRALSNTPKRTIGLRDEAALTWFFGPGMATFERSVFGAMCERMQRDGANSKRCPKCHGEGVLNEGGFASRTKKDDDQARRNVKAGGWCEACNGTGAVPAERGKHPPCRTGTIACPPCSGTGIAGLKRHRKGPLRGKRARRRAEILESAAPCMRCRATGVIEVDPAFGTDDGAYIVPGPNDEALTRYGVISRRVAILSRRDPRLVEVLRAYYGDAGSRWGRERQGRIFAVYPLTRAGKSLLRLGGKAQGNAASLRDSERLGVESELEKTQPKEQRRALLDAADRQAREMYARTAEVWNTIARQR
jgi:hypothetical protein